MNWRPYEKVVREGSYLYDQQVECQVRIVLGPVRQGTGDDEDPPDIANDIQQDCYCVWYSSITDRDHFNAGGGGYPSLAAAMAAVEAAPGIGASVRWKQDEQ